MEAERAEAERQRQEQERLERQRQEVEFAQLEKQRLEKERLEARERRVAEVQDKERSELAAIDKDARDWQSVFSRKTEGFTKEGEKIKQEICEVLNWSRHAAQLRDLISTENTRRSRVFAQLAAQQKMRKAELIEERTKIEAQIAEVNSSLSSSTVDDSILISFSAATDGGTLQEHLQVVVCLSKQ